MEPFTVRCPGIENGKFLIDHTGRGADRSPELVLENLSPKAVSLAVVLEDMSHPLKGFTHWVFWNLPVSERIPEGIPAGVTVPGGGVQGVAYGLHRYAGPKPPVWSVHSYRLRPGLQTGAVRRQAKESLPAGGGGAYPPEWKYFRGI